MDQYNLIFAWNWEHDVDFARLFCDSCASKGISLVQAGPANLDELLHALEKGIIGFQSLFDRASDLDERFLPLVEWACERGLLCINPYPRAAMTWDKAFMHQTLAAAGLDTPYTVVLPPYQEQPVLWPVDLQLLGAPFVIKPVNGSGGKGVLAQASSLSQVLDLRREYPTDRYLLQAHIFPRQHDDRQAWFRVLYCAGQVYPCWWHPETHLYAQVTAEEEQRYGLGPLRETTERIAQLSGLDLFSTEIAHTAAGIFVVVDYVNDQIDLRLQSKNPDGVPDAIVTDITEHLSDLVVRHCLPATWLEWICERALPHPGI